MINLKDQKCLIGRFFHRNYASVSDFHSYEVVGRGSKTQFQHVQVGENTILHGSNISLFGCVVHTPQS